MSNIERAWTIIECLTSKGYNIDLSVDNFGCQRIMLSGGDCNCPYPKQYDPSDGHGYTHLDSEDWPEWDLREYDVLEAVEILVHKLNDLYPKEAPVVEMSRHQPAKLDDGGSSPSRGSI